MIDYLCTHCGTRLEAPESLCGQDQKCPQCAQRTVVPIPMARLASKTISQPLENGPQPPGIIKVPLLISAICNCVMAFLWFITPFSADFPAPPYCIIFAVPLIVLLIFEFKLYADLHDPKIVVPSSRVRTIAIYEIVAGLVNLGALVCGIIILTNLANADINKGKVPV